MQWKYTFKLKKMQKATLTGYTKSLTVFTVEGLDALAHFVGTLSKPGHSVLLVGLNSVKSLYSKW